jgi:hypothetical protein
MGGKVLAMKEDNSNNTVYADIELFESKCRPDDFDDFYPQLAFIINEG